MLPKCDVPFPASPPGWMPVQFDVAATCSIACMPPLMKYFASLY